MKHASGGGLGRITTTAMVQKSDGAICNAHRDTLFFASKRFGRFRIEP